MIPKVGKIEAHHEGACSSATPRQIAYTGSSTSERRRFAVCYRQDGPMLAPPFGTKSPPRILIADADNVTREFHAAAFRAEGWDVLEAADGREALTMALVRPASLVVPDAHLPFSDGFALCELIRRDSSTRSVAVVLLTNDAAATRRARRLAQLRCIHGRFGSERLWKWRRQPNSKPHQNSTAHHAAES
jgi:CheY-like chemotaxis protein